LAITLQQVLFRLVALLIVAAVHGYSLAWAADRLGDPGPRYDGRKTLDPFAHLDLLGGLGFVLFGFGWIKPMVLDREELNPGRLGPVLVALAGLASVLLLAGVAELMRRPLILSASGNLPLYGIVLLETLSTLSLSFVLINLVPVPPLTGAHFLRGLVPAVALFFDRYRTGFTVLVAAFVASGLAGWIFLPIYRPVARLMLGA